MVEYIRSRFRPGKYNHATLNCVYQLVTGGHDDAAFTVFSMFDFRSGYADTEGTIRLSHNLLRCMIARGRVGTSQMYAADVQTLNILV